MVIMGGGCRGVVVWVFDVGSLGCFCCIVLGCEFRFWVVVVFVYCYLWGYVESCGDGGLFCRGGGVLVWLLGFGVGFVFSCWVWEDFVGEE